MKHSSNLPSCHKRKLWLQSFYGFLIMLALAFLLMPIASSEQLGGTAFLFCNGILFWLGLLGCIGMMLFVSNRRKICEFESNVHIGIFRFLAVPKTKIVDLCMIVSFLVLLISLFVIKLHFLPFVSLSVLVVTIGLHCLWSGRNYPFLIYRVRRQNHEASEN